MTGRSMSDIYAEVKLDLAKEEESRLRKKIGSIDTRAEGKKVAGRFGVGFNGAFGGIVKHSAGLFVGAFAAIKGVQVLGGFISDARESAKVARISAAAIKSTGGAARITAAQVGSLATAISNKTGADDEAIQSGENLLLTFTGVRNEVGKGNDIFNQASQAVTDMSAALNNGDVSAEGLKASSIQLGKALNDPVKGVTALQKVGVSFTESQKKQIKTLVDSGQTLKAQQIILGEVNKEFGGAAAAASDPLTKLKTIVGNLAEQLGGYLLPAVDKFATFIGDRAVPAISGLADLIFKGDFTKTLGDAFNISEDSGFVAFILNARANLVLLFDYVKTEVLPRLTDFAGWIIGKVIPALVSLGTTIVTTLQPIITGLVVLFVTQVLPRLKDFSGWVVDKVVPALSSMAGFVKQNSDFFVPFTAAIFGIVAALKAWAVVQGALDLLLSSNPIGVVVVAVAGLATGVIYAYQHSEKFRQVVQDAWDVLKGFGAWINDNIVPVLHDLAGTFRDDVLPRVNDLVVAFRRDLLPALQELWAVLSASVLPQLAALTVALDRPIWVGAFASAILGLNAAIVILTGSLSVMNYTIRSIKAIVQTVIPFVVGVFLDFVGSMVGAAAAAFGWVPGLGPKLRTAATEFGKFRDAVNAKLDGLRDQTLNFAIKYSSAGVNLSAPSSVGRRAYGGPGGSVRGPGTGTSDTAGIYALSNGEHVWTAREVAKAGGHAAMYRMRKAVLGGHTGGLAAGGRPGVTIKTNFPSPAKIAADAADTAVAIATPVAKAFAKQMAQSLGPGGPPGSVHSFRGVTLNTRTIGMLLNAEKILHRVFHLMQGSYSTRVAASGGTHAGGGAMDTDGPGGWGRAVQALRSVGFAAWHRTPAQGPWGHHIHSIAIGDPTASPAAKRQVQSYLRGGDGLGHGMFRGGKVGVFDRGGLLASGGAAINTSGGPERILTTSQTSLFDRLLKIIPTLVASFDRLKTGIGVTVDRINDIVSKAKEFAAATTSSFTGSLFGSGTNVGDLKLRLDARRNDALGFRKSLQILKGKHLNASLWNQLAESSDYGAAQQLAGMSAAQLAGINKSFLASGNAVSALGGYAAGTRYGAQLQQQQDLLRREQSMEKVILRALKKTRIQLMQGGRPVGELLVSNG